VNENESTGLSSQPYKYGGKEEEPMFGLNMLDFHARRLDLKYDRFSTPDPLAEKYPWLSPYNYCAGNPVRNVDPTGMSYWEFTLENIKMNISIDMLDRNKSKSEYNFRGYNKDIATNYVNSKGKSIVNTNDGSDAVVCIDALPQATITPSGGWVPVGDHETSEVAWWKNINTGEQCSEYRVIGLKNVHPEFDLLFLGRGMLSTFGNAAAGSVAKGGTQFTTHGVERIAGATATRGGVLSMEGVNATKSLGRVFTQADGAKVFLHEITSGRFNVVVEGNRDIITTMNNWSQSSIDRIARNYGWIIK
jgi:RHS repeat-associated protein